MENSKNENIEEKKIGKNLKLPKYLLAGLIGLQVIVLIAQIVILKGCGGGSKGEDSGITTFFPI